MPTNHAWVKSRARAWAVAPLVATAAAKDGRMHDVDEDYLIGKPLISGILVCPVAASRPSAAIAAPLVTEK